MVSSLVENLAVTMNGGYGTIATGTYSAGTALTAGDSYWLISEGTTAAQWASTNAPSSPIVENEYPNLAEPIGVAGGLYPGGSYSSTLAPLGLEVSVSQVTVAAPEIDSGSTASGVMLLLGSLAILRGRRSNINSSSGGLAINCHG